MANVTQSIEELTASLQELTSGSYNNCVPVTAGQLPVDELSIPQEVESFVRDTIDYADKTRSISSGIY